MLKHTAQRAAEIVKATKLLDEESELTSIQKTELKRQIIHIAKDCESIQDIVSLWFPFPKEISVGTTLISTKAEDEALSAAVIEMKKWTEIYS